MLYWALVEQARHEYMSDEYKNGYIIVVLLKPPSWVYQTNTTSPHLVPSELIKGAKVKRANTGLPNTYRRSTTETIMHPIGQNILLIYPHFGIDFLHLTLSLPSRFAPSVRLMVGVSPQALWLYVVFSCDCMFWDEKEGRLTRQLVGPFGNTATMTTVMSTNRVDSGGGVSSRCCAFQRSHTSVDPIQLLCIRLALPWTLSLPTGFAPSTILMVGVSLRALCLAEDFWCDCIFQGSSR